MALISILCNRLECTISMLTLLDGLVLGECTNLSTLTLPNGLVLCVVVPGAVHHQPHTGGTIVHHDPVCLDGGTQLGSVTGCQGGVVGQPRPKVNVVQPEGAHYPNSLSPQDIVTAGTSANADVVLLNGRMGIMDSLPINIQGRHVCLEVNVCQDRAWNTVIDVARHRR